MGAFSRKRLRERFITFAGAVYNVCIRGCKRYPWRTHVFAFKVDQIGPGGCSALRGRLQCTASEMGKTGTEIVSPILDKRKGKRDTPHMGHSSPPDLSTEPAKCLYTSIMIVETLVLSDSVLHLPLPHNAT